jgi:hypothetical protein
MLSGLSVSRPCQTLSVRSDRLKYDRCEHACPIAIMVCSCPRVPFAYMVAYLSVRNQRE